MTEAARDPSDRDRDREHLTLVGRAVDGKYNVLRLIGRGGMGAVYEAENLGIGKRVAIKFIDREWAKDDIVASRFAREARAASSIDSEHIVSVFDAGTADGRPYLVMELLRGEDLGTRLRRQARLGVDEAVHVVAQTLRGLASAHAAGIVHRDLKPDNLFLVRRDDDASFVKIVDFGISKIEKAKSGTAPLALTQRGIVLGTPLYMSPEQAQAFHDLDARADLFSVGAILFECLTGRPPHTGETYEQIIVAICMRDAPDVRELVPGVPDAVAAVVARALKRDRAERYQSASEMLAALRAVAPSDAATRPLSLPHATLVSAQAVEVRAAPETSGVFAPKVAVPPTPAHPTDVSWTSGARAPVKDAAYEVPGARTRVPLVATALLATIAGVALTLGIVRMTRTEATPAASASASSASTAIAPPPATTPATTPPAATATATATAIRRVPTPPKPSAPPPPPPTPKPGALDLHREPPP